MSSPGRPSSYTPELAEAICSRLAAGESLRAICKDDGFPDRATVSSWVVHDRDGFAARYAQARDLGLDEMADECLAIADKAEADYVAGMPSPEIVHRTRLRIEQRRWYLSKLAPKRYGDKLGLEHSGGLALQVVSGVPSKGEDAFDDLV